MRDYFAANRCPIDVVFYTNYERQVEAPVNGHIDMAWNSPLAWVQFEKQTNGRCRAIAMRDTDRDRTSCIVVRADSDTENLTDLCGKTVAVGAKDSPQATLIPVGVIRREGLDPGSDLHIRRFDLQVGKHGDQIGGELKAFECLKNGEADASTMLDLNWNVWTSNGTIDSQAFRVLATTPHFDHCVFAVREDFDQAAEQQWLDVR